MFRTMQPRFRPLVAAGCVLVLLAGCASPPPRDTSPFPTGTRVDLGNSAEVKQRLDAQYRQWRGAKYRIGGLSTHGIDCSGFMYVTFKTKLGVVLPRSTERQAEVGRASSAASCAQATWCSSGPAVRSGTSAYTWRMAGSCTPLPAAG